MRYLLYNWEDIKEDINDPSDLSDEEFEDVVVNNGGLIFQNEEDFESAFNAEMISTETHQLRIVRVSEINILK